MKRRGKKASYRNTERYSVIIGEEEREGEGDVLAGDWICNTSTNKRAAHPPFGGKVEGPHAMVWLNVRL